MDIDPFVVLAGLIVGFVVGLTGMGGGALMTPVLVLLFNVQPLAAVSSDLVASAVMKPVGSAVHMRRGTVHWNVAGWLVLGSVPAAFTGVLVLRAVASGESVQDVIKLTMGVMLLVAAGAMVAKNVLDRRRGVVAGARAGSIKAKPLPTVAVGVVGGLAVGMTSVGSGSLIIVMLLALYPRIAGSQLVGTDLVQAVPLVVSASIGHLLFGDFQLGLTGSLLLGSLPGVYLGARISAGPAANRLIRPVLAVVISLTGLKLIGVPTVGLGIALAVVVVVSVTAARARRRTVSAVPATGAAPGSGARHNSGVPSLANSPIDGQPPSLPTSLNASNR